MILECNYRHILPVIEQTAKSHNIYFNSCLDIGCGMNPLFSWFGTRLENAIAPKTYTGIDVSPSVLEHWRDKINVIHADTLPPIFMADLVTGCDVLEHLTQENTPSFLEFCRNKTAKMLAISTPNFEYWNEKRHGKDPELRFVPDHFINYDPNSKDPGFHKQFIEPDSLLHLLTQHFTTDLWEVRVFRGAPWLLEDIPFQRTYKVYFKIFALCWRKYI